MGRVGILSAGADSCFDFSKIKGRDTVRAAHSGGIGGRTPNRAARAARRTVMIKELYNASAKQPNESVQPDRRTVLRSYQAPSIGSVKGKDRVGAGRKDRKETVGRGRKPVGIASPSQGVLSEKSAEVNKFG